MKKLIAILLAALTCFALVGCGGNSAPAADAKLDMTLEEIVEAVNAGVELPAVGNIPVDAESFPYFAFIEYKEGYEALASEAMMSAQAHSVVLVRVPEGEDVAAVAAEIEKNADPRKWICVEAEKTVVTVKGDVIMLCMSNAAAADAIVANFEALS